MPYDSIGGTKVTYQDGALKVLTSSSQPKIIILGTAKSGRSYELFNIGPISEAEYEFGADSEALQGVHEAEALGADNISMVRIGGRPGHVLITTTSGESLRISPDLFRDAEALSRYSLILEAEQDGDQRVILYDLELETFVYDSEEILASDVGIMDVRITPGFVNWSLGDAEEPAESPSLATLVALDFTAEHGATDTIDTIDVVSGSDGATLSLPERYAALATAYHRLDYEDGDIVVPKNAYLDARNVADGHTPDYSAGVPVPGSDGDVLGLAWHYIYRGSIYTWMIEDEGVLSETALLEIGDTGVVLFEAIQPGPAGEAVEVIVVDTGTVVSPAPPEVVVTGNTILIDIDEAATTADEVVTAINASVPAAALVVATGQTPGILGVTSLEASRLTLAGVLSHQDLTGDEIPPAVRARWERSVGAEFREVNFAHQLASFCHLSSANWKTMIGVISTTGPDGYDRSSVAEWVGEPPTYRSVGGTAAILSAGDNGYGLLGNKFMSGEAGYRSHMLKGGSGANGLAYGGLILTKGSGLPNGSDFPYGINDADEATDKGGQPVDIGKHIIVTSLWWRHRNSYNGGARYRGDFAAGLAGKLAVTPANKDPIGVTYGRVIRVSDPARLHSTVVNDLAKARLVNVRRDPSAGYVLSSVRTAAHPNSDYVRPSTIRTANLLLQGIRSIANEYVGSEYLGMNLLDLQTAIDGYLQGQKILQNHGGAIATLHYSRSDKILGKLQIKLRFVPPLSIEFIEVETSLAADESELA